MVLSTIVGAGGLDESLWDRIAFPVTFASAIAVVALMTFIPAAQNDLLLQIKVGELISNSHEIPKTLIFPFTEAKDFPFHAHEWIPSLVFYFLDRQLGLENLIFVQGAFGLLLFAACYLLAFRLVPDRATALFLAILTVVATNYRYYLRPELFALAFMLALIFVLVEYRQRGNRLLLWLIPPIYLVWVNSHGSFPIALLLVALFGLGEGLSAAKDRDRTKLPLLRAGFHASAPYLAVLLAMLVVGLLNPEGYRLILFPLTFAQSVAAKTYIEEWQPTLSRYFFSTRAFYTYAYLLLVCGIVLAFAWKRIGDTERLVIICFGVLSLSRFRYIVFFAYAAMFVLAIAFARLTPSRSPRKPLTVPLLFACNLIGAMALIQHGNAHGAYPYYVPNNRFSEPMIQYLRKPEVSGNVLNSFELGADVIYHFYPKLRPVIDSRIDSYGDAYFYACLKLFSDEDELNNFIAGYDVRYILVLREEFAGISQMKSLRENGWRLAFADHKMILLGR